MSQNVVAIVPAAGSSTRMGGSASKLQAIVGNVSVLEHTLQSLINAGVSSIVVMVREIDIIPFRKACISFPADLVVGGVTRQESVQRGVEALSGKVSNDAIVVVHDGARCLATADLIRKCIDEAKRCGAVSAALPVVDSLTRSDESGNYGSPVDRDNLWQVQTPQVFRYELLKKAHELAINNATDDASLVATFHPVHLVTGERENIKITTAHDLTMADAIVRSRVPFQRAMGE